MRLLVKTEFVAMGARTPDIIPSRSAECFPRYVFLTSALGMFLPRTFPFLVSAAVLLPSVSAMHGTVCQLQIDWQLSAYMFVCWVWLNSLRWFKRQAGTNSESTLENSQADRPKVFPKNGIKFPPLMLRMTVIEPVYLKLQPEFWIWLI